MRIRLRILSSVPKITDIPNERIASVCGVSEGTLAKCLKKLEAAVKAGTIVVPPLEDATAI